jgi:hypothetical protein
MTQDLAVLLSEAEETLVALDGIPCDSEASAALLNEIFVFAYGKANALERDLKEETEPHTAKVKEAKARLMPLIDRLREVENVVRTKVELAALESLERKEAGQEALILAARNGESLALPETLTPLPGDLSVSFSWSFEFTGEDLPPEFLEPSSKKVTEFLKQYKNSSHVPARPGVRWKRVALTKAKAGAGK